MYNLKFCKRSPPYQRVAESSTHRVPFIPCAEDHILPDT